MTNAEKMVAELDNPYILLVEKKISSMKELLPVLEPVAQQGKSLLIISEEVEGGSFSNFSGKQIKRFY